MLEKAKKKRGGKEAKSVLFLIPEGKNSRIHCFASVRLHNLIQWIEFILEEIEIWQ